jgi:lipopolysaccharide/colanic/teichoic acid biosynthesis glycosyltransferase
MQFRDWDSIPMFMQNEEVKKYYDILGKKRFDLKIKRLFDVVVSVILIILFPLIFFAVSIWIKIICLHSVTMQKYFL